MKKRIRFFVLFCFLILGILFWNDRKENEKNSSYPKISLEFYLNKIENTNLEKEDYQSLYLQTGLGKLAVDELIQRGEEKKYWNTKMTFLQKKE